MPEVKSKRLADVINVIGKNLPKVTISKVTPQIFYNRPEIGEIIKKEDIIKPKNVYELTSMIGVPESDLWITKEVERQVMEKIPVIYKKRRLPVPPTPYTRISPITHSPWEMGRIISRRIEEALRPTWKIVYHTEIEKVKEENKEAKKALEKIVDLAQKYPITEKQAKAIYEILKVPLNTNENVMKFKNAMDKYWKDIITAPEGLKEKIQNILSKKAESAVKKAKEKYKLIEEEKMRLPEYVWQRGYRGETLAERARAKAREYNENIKNIVEYTKNIASSLSKEDTAKYIATYLNSDLAWEVAKEIYRKSGGRVDLSNLHRDLTEVAEKSERYLKEVSSTLQKLFDIKADLLSEVKDLLKDIV